MSKEIKVVTAIRVNEGVEYETVYVDSFSGFKGENLLAHSFLIDSFRKLMGRTLTLIDSSITDKNQNKAMKDIVRGIFSDEMEFAGDMCFDQKKLEKMIPEDAENIPAVSIEEALGV